MSNTPEETLGTKQSMFFIAANVLSEMINQWDALSNLREHLNKKHANLIKDGNQWISVKFDPMELYEVYSDHAKNLTAMSLADRILLQDVTSANSLAVLQFMSNCEFLRFVSISFNGPNNTMVCSCQVSFPLAVDLMTSEETRERLAREYIIITGQKWNSHCYMPWKYVQFTNQETPPPSNQVH